MRPRVSNLVRQAGKPYEYMQAVKGAQDTQDETAGRMWLSTVKAFLAQ
jgi:hypothetical protein